jgi:hypothetical protein
MTPATSSGCPIRPVISGRMPYTADIVHKAVDPAVFVHRESTGPLSLPGWLSQR